MDRVMHIVLSMKQEGKSLKTEELFANTTYYRLRAVKHFGYYIIGLGDKGYRVGSTEEIFNQVFVVPRARRCWKTMGEKPKFKARMRLRGSQRHGGTMANAMQSDLPDAIWDIVQVNQWGDASGIDESRCVLRGRSKALRWVDKSQKIQREGDQNLEDENEREQRS